MVILFTPRHLSSYNATFTLSAKQKQKEINFNFTAWIPFWPGRVDFVWANTKGRRDDKQGHGYGHWTSLDWIWDCESESWGAVAFKAPVLWREKKKKSDGENIGEHVFELRSLTRRRSQWNIGRATPLGWSSAGETRPLHHLWSSRGWDTFLTVVLKPHVGGGGLQPPLPAPNNCVFFFFTFTSQQNKKTKKLHIYKYKNMKWHELTSLV